MPFFSILLFPFVLSPAHPSPPAHELIPLCVYVVVCVSPQSSASIWRVPVPHAPWKPKRIRSASLSSCHLSIPLSSAVFSFEVLILPPPASPHPLLKFQVLTSVSLQPLTTTGRWWCCCICCAILSFFYLYVLLLGLSGFTISLYWYFCVHLLLSHCSSSSVWNLGGSWSRVAKRHDWTQHQQHSPPSLLLC